jgi:hypothetical protein
MTAPTTIERPKVSAEVFTKAIQIVREGGLTKHSYIHLADDGTVEHCSVGAIREAVTGSAHNTDHRVVEAVEFLANEVLGLEPYPCVCGCGELYGDAFSLVTRWNDAPERTQGEVVAAMETAKQKASS